jgi:hypothetical protein
VTWGALSVDIDEEQDFSIGDVALRVRRTPEDWRVMVEGSPVTDPGINGRWTVVRAREQTGIRILPATPDLPVVLKPEEPIALTPRATAQYDIVLPLWIRIFPCKEKNDSPVGGDLLDIPTQLVRRTWFGTDEAGEVAYGWKFSGTRRYVRTADTFRVPLRIKNESDSILWFERMLLRVVHLNLYQIEGRLVSDDVTVAFRGAEQFSQVTYGSGKTQKPSRAHPIAVHRQSVSSDIIRKSFIWLRDLAV